MNWFKRKHKISPIFQQVIDDLAYRDAQMQRKHGRPMTSDRYKKPLLEAYHEQLDECIYIKAELERRRKNGT